MSVTIDFSKKSAMGFLQNPDMLKSTKEKLQRQAERDGKVAYFEAQKQNLKNKKAETVEEIERKLELFHNYDDQIVAAKQEYNSSQMLHVSDEAREQAEKIAKAAKKSEPKTEEERKEEAIKEAAGIEDDGGLLSESMDRLTETTEQTQETLEEKLTEESLEQTEESVEKTGEQMHRMFDMRV